MPRGPTREIAFAAALAIASAAIALLAPPSLPRFLAAIVHLLFVTGYSLTLALFPRRHTAAVPASADAFAPPSRAPPGLTLGERAAMGAVLSLLATPAVGLILVFTAGVSLASATWGALLFSLVALGGASFRIRGKPSGEPSAWSALGPAQRGLALAIAVTLLAGTIGVAAIVEQRPPPEAFVELYLLPSSGRAEGFPSTVVVGAEQEILVGVTSHEHEAGTFALRADIEEVDLTSEGAVVLGEARELSVWTSALVPGETDERALTFTLPTEGRYRLHVQLAREGEPVSHEVHLWLTAGGA